MKRSRHDRAFRDIHGGWPEDFAEEPEAEAEASVEFRQTVAGGPGMTMEKVVRLRPRRLPMRYTLFERICAAPGLLLAYVWLGLGAGAWGLAAFVLIAAVITAL